MSSESIEITTSLSTEEIQTANPNLIAKILDNAGIKKRDIIEFLLGLSKEHSVMDNPEKRAIKKEKIELIRKLLYSVLDLKEDDSQDDDCEMPEELPLQQIVTEQPKPAQTNMPPDFADIKAEKKKERFIN